MLISLLFSEPMFFLTWVLAIVVGITVHEFSHALAATLLGDSTPRSMGRLSLNPLAHLDPLGTVMLLLVGFGYGKPVQFDPTQLRNPRIGSAIVGAAGPISNLLMVAFFGLCLRFFSYEVGLPEGNLLLQFLVNLIQINVVLMVFNLFPIPPLDGSKVLFAILPRSLDRFKTMLEHYGPWILLGLLIFGRGIFSSIFSYFLQIAARFID